MIETKETIEVKLNTIEEAVQAIKDGEVIIVVDDEDRENEGDFVCAADKITPEIINFMAKWGRGLICAPITSDRVEKLGLNMMVPENTSHHDTAFTVSVDYKGKGCTTGISAYDRSTCVKALTDPNAKHEDFVIPGHIFPLKAKKGGVLERVGHTEASVDLANLAGLESAAVLVEILNDDGSMARLPELMTLSKKFDMPIISIKDLVDYRMKNERLILENESMPLSLDAGEFELLIIDEADQERQHIALKHGSWSSEDEVPVRVESIRPNEVLMQFLAGRMDENIRKSLDIIVREGKGLLVFVMRNEIQQTQTEIADQILRRNKSTTVIPSEVQKDIGIGAQIIRSQNIKRMKLITNNPERHVAVSGYGLEIVESISLK